MSHQGRAEKPTGAFFEDDHVARLRFEFFLDLKRSRIDFAALAVGRVYNLGFRLRAGFAGGVKNRYFERSRQSEKLLRRLDRVVRVNTAGTFVGVDELVRFLGAAFVGEVIKVDR